MNGTVPQLDEMLEPHEAAAWLRLKPRDLSAKSSGHKPKIPVFELSRKNRRFHPRTIIAKLARDAGVPQELIAASFGISETK